MTPGTGQPAASPSTRVRGLGENLTGTRMTARGCPGVTWLEVTGAGTRVLGPYPAGPVLVDGKGVGDVGGGVSDRSVRTPRVVHLSGDAGCCDHGVGAVVDGPR